MTRRCIAGVLALVAFTQSHGCARSAQVTPRVSAEAWTRITTGMDGFLARVETLDDYPPGSAVVIVTTDGRRYVRLHGETKAGSGHAVTADSAFYIASMTKAYVGLLAARLDAEGVLPLTTTLAEVWPGVRLPPGGRQADAITLRDLLVHSIPFRVPEITFLEAYVRDVAPSEYPHLIERYAVARRDGFQYDNLGYNIYAAALEAKTGRNWRVWLDETVFSPLGMTRTSGKTSGYGAGTIAWNHQLAGTMQDAWPRAGTWYLLPPKADGMMQSAGGLMTSPNDMARWLEAHLKGEGPAGSGLTREIFTRARQDQVARSEDNNGFSCQGYVYGWRVCSLFISARTDWAGEDHVLGPILQHGGGYTGVRSLMAAAPDLGFAVAFLSNSDSMTGFLGQEVTKLVFELSRNISGERDRRDWRIASFTERNANYLAGLQRRLRNARADAKWKGWSWRPNPEELGAFTGSYNRSGALMPDATVHVDDVLTLASGERRYRLTPAAPDLFGAQTFAYDEIVPVAFIRDSDGRVVAMDWDGERYTRR